MSPSWHSTTSNDSSGSARASALASRQSIAATGRHGGRAGGHHHRQAQHRLQDALGIAWQDHDLLFPRHDGRWWNPPAISIAFRRAVERSGVPRSRLHDVRHTHATLLLAAGVNAKVVSERLGHSSVSFTLDTYAHVIPGMQPDAAERFMGLVFGPVDPPLPLSTTPRRNSYERRS